MRAPIYVEYEYSRAGACAYIAAWDVQRAKLFGRCQDCYAVEGGRTLKLGPERAPFTLRYQHNGVPPTSSC